MSKAMPRPTRLVINGRFLTQQATGVQRVAREVTRAIDRLMTDGLLSGTEIILATPSAAPTESLDLRNVAIQRVGHSKGYIWEQIELPRFAGNSLVLCLGNTGPILSMIVGRQVAVMLHDQSYKLFPDGYSFFYRAIHAVMDHIIVRAAQPLITVSNTESAQLSANNKTVRREIIVAPNGIWNDDVAQPARQKRSPGTPAYGLHVGGFGQRKNIEAVFATAAALANDGIRFLLAGKPNSHAEALYGALSDAERSMIEFTGYVTDERLNELYRGAAFLLYPSFYEASGLPPTEAMALGCPVILSDLPVLRERCGDAAIYCPPDAHEQFIAAARSLLRDHALATTLSASGLEQSDLFTWRNQALCILNALGLPPTQIQGRRPQQSDVAVEAPLAAARPVRAPRH